MISKRPLEAGDLLGTIYDFSEVGDEIAKHVHTEDNVHITIVCKGSIKAYSHDWEKRRSAPAVLKFRAGEPHAIQALEAGTCVINIITKMGGHIGHIDVDF